MTKYYQIKLSVMNPSHIFYLEVCDAQKGDSEEKCIAPKTQKRLVGHSESFRLLSKQKVSLCTPPLLSGALLEKRRIILFSENLALDYPPNIKCHFLPHPSFLGRSLKKDKFFIFRENSFKLPSKRKVSLLTPPLLRRSLKKEEKILFSENLALDDHPNRKCHF